MAGLGQKYLNMKNTGYSGLSLHGHGDFLLTVSEVTPVSDLVTPQDPTESTILQHGHHHLAWADQKLVVWFAFKISYKTWSLQT